MTKAYEIIVDKSVYAYDVRLGCICIANMWPPKRNRPEWQVRLLFNQEPGKIDYSKDKRFESQKECESYIHKELVKWVKVLNRYFILNKK